MSSDEETQRTSVRTYVPAYQKRRWAEQAEQFGMSQSEFVRVMVQAGRRGFSVDPLEADDEGSNPGGDGLEARLEEILRTAGPLDWDGLLREVKADFEEELENKLEAGLDELQDAGKVKYSGRDGGYVLADE